MSSPETICRFSAWITTVGTLLVSMVCAFPLSTARGQSPIRPGDRVAIVGNTFADQLRMHGYLETLLLSRSSENPISIRNLGWAGDMLAARDRPTNFATEESTLVAHQTDVIIACFGMGESFAGEEGLDAFKQALREFIATHRGKTYNGKTTVRLVLVSPIAYEDLGDFTPQHEQRNAQIEAYTQVMAEEAEGAKLPFVNLLAPTRYLMQEPGAPRLTTNGIQLNAYGYWAISRVFCQSLWAGENSNFAAKAWRIRIDAESVAGEAEGVDISQTQRNGSTLQFTITETTWPSLPAPPTKPAPHPQLMQNLDSLIVENLDPGNYVLTIDSQRVVSANEAQWHQGVSIVNSPAHIAAEAFRQSVNDKNLQFTYSWKALNQVHIVGERRTSPSGRALPAEVVEFYQLAEQREQALHSGIELKARQWQLSPE